MFCLFEQKIQLYYEYERANFINSIKWRIHTENINTINASINENKSHQTTLS